MSKEKINPSTKIVQNLLILQTVNQEFMNDLNSLRNGEFYNSAKELEKSLKSEVSKLRDKYNLSPAYQTFIEDLAELPVEANNIANQKCKKI